MTVSLVPVLATIAVLVVGGVLIARRFPVSDTDTEGSVGTLVVPCLMSIYLVAMAMGIVIGWENHHQADSGVEDEAAAATELYWSTQNFPDDDAGRVRDALRDYLTTVERDDWAAMRDRELSPTGDRAMDRLRRSVGDVSASDPSAGLVRMAAIQTADDLVGMRAQRAESAQDHIPRIVTVAAAISAFAVAVLPFGMGVRRSRARIFWSVANLAFVAGTIVVLLYLDNPYTGMIVVEPGPLQEALDGFDRIDRELAR